MSARSRFRAAYSSRCRCPAKRAATATCRTKRRAASSPPFRCRNYAQSFYKDNAATLEDLREAVTTLEDVVRIARRVLGGEHPFVGLTELRLRNARATARARELNVSSLADELEAMTPGDA